MLVLLVSTPVRADLFNKSYAVVIGISSYQNANVWKKLDNAENDAKAMNDYFKEQGFNVKQFIGREATKNNIISYLEDDLAQRLERDDRFVFYFSGHGSTRQFNNNDWGYLIPYDGDDAEKPSSWIAMEQLRELAGKLGKARHQLFILDSCFGGLFATKGSMSSIPEGTSSYINEVTGQRARQYLTAGGKNERTPASSNLDGYKEYSHYTAYLLKGLREGAADTSRDGYITASELDAYLGPAATTSNNKPRGGDFPGHEQGNFVFRSPKPAQISMSEPVPAGPTKGDEDKHDWEMLSKLGAEGLRTYIDKHPNGKWADEARDRTARLQPKPEPQRPSSSASVKRMLPKAEQDRLESEWQREQHANSSAAVTRTISKEEQDQIDYEWQDIQGAASSHTIELFLERYPVGSHVSAAQRKLEELRARGR